ncbi:MAG: flippase-like domain-containing protein [Lachnospiraceae bacterium]|nr:flippase-like domain-containing protein [Lachnospiraceae bacterium]
MKKKKTVLWSCVAVLITGLTVYAVFENSRSLTLSEVLDALGSASPFWLIVAFLCACGFIVFEMLALLWALKHLGYRRKLRQGLLYSAGDIYFSAITPSASGGQPASAVFMHQDRIPSAVISVVLLINLIMYTLAILTIGTLCLIQKPQLFMVYSPFSRFLIVFGMTVLSFLAFLFFALLKQGRILHKVGLWLIRLLFKLHILKNEEKWTKKLDRIVEEYKLCSDSLKGQRKMLFVLYLLNLLQRISQISVTPMIYLAMSGDSRGTGPTLWILQAFAQIGANCIPLPGGIGVADYLMLDGFSFLFDSNYAYKLEILSRGFSFYICTLLSGIILLISSFLTRRKPHA